MNDNPQKLELTLGGYALPAGRLSRDSRQGVRGAAFCAQWQYLQGGDEAPIQPIRVHADRAYTMNEPASFVEAVKKYGDPDTGIIFYKGLHGQNNATTITMFFNEDSRKESISLPLSWSLEFRAFLNGQVKMFTQKEFLKIIDTYPECINLDGSKVPIFRAMVERLQLSTKIDFESNADPLNMTFIYKETASGSDQIGRIPKTITLDLPFYEGSKNKVTIKVDMEVTTPKADNEKPLFKLSNVKHERTERDALKSEIKSLSDALPGWTFVNGTF